MNLYDVAIIGAGPAGSSAAIALCRKGYAVALLDKERFPREKLCGDFLNPINWPLLRALGVDKELLERPHEKVTTFRFSSFSGEEAEVPLPQSDDGALFGLGVRRFDLDVVLLNKAQSEGATHFQACKLRDLKREPKSWLLHFERQGRLEGFRARALIGADGRNSWVARRLGLAERETMQGRSIGFQVRLKCSNRATGKVEIHLFPGGYAGMVGLDKTTVNLCLAIEKDRLPNGGPQPFLMQICLPQNWRLKEILRTAGVSEMRSTYPVYFPPRRVHGDGVLLVGDAARVSEPVTGEGIYFALKSGQIAAGAIHQAFCRGDFSARKLSSYERECRSAFRGRLRVNALIRWLIYRPGLLSLLIGLSKKRPSLLHSMVQMICQPEIGLGRANLIDSNPFVVR